MKICLICHKEIDPKYSQNDSNRTFICDECRDFCAPTTCGYWLNLDELGVLRPIRLFQLTNTLFIWKINKDTFKPVK